MVSFLQWDERAGLEDVELLGLYFASDKSRFFAPFFEALLDENWIPFRPIRKRIIKKGINVKGSQRNSVKRSGCRF